MVGPHVLLLVLRVAVSAGVRHSCSVVMRWFHRTLDVLLLVSGLVSRVHRLVELTRSLHTSAGRRLADFHPRAEGVLEEDAILRIHHGVVVLDGSLVILRWAEGLKRCVALIFTVVKVVRRDALPLRVLLSTCRPWVEEIVNALKCSVALAGDLGAVFGERVLELNIGEASEHLVAVQTLVDLTLTASDNDASVVLRGHDDSFVNRLPLLKLSVRRGLRLVLAVWSQRQHILLALILVTSNTLRLLLLTRVLLARHTVLTIRPVKWSFDHRRKLKLLVVGVVALLPTVALALTDFLNLHLVLPWRSRGTASFTRGLVRAVRHQTGVWTSSFDPLMALVAGELVEVALPLGVSRTRLLRDCVESVVGLACKLSSSWTAERLHVIDLPHLNLRCSIIAGRLLAYEAASLASVRVLVTALVSHFLPAARLVHALVVTLGPLCCLV